MPLRHEVECLMAHMVPLDGLSVVLRDPPPISCIDLRRPASTRVTFFEAFLNMFFYIVLHAFWWIWGPSWLPKSSQDGSKIGPKRGQKGSKWRHPSWRRLGGANHVLSTAISPVLVLVVGSFWGPMLIDFWSGLVALEVASGLKFGLF